MTSMAHTEGQAITGKRACRAPTIGGGSKIGHFYQYLTSGGIFQFTVTFKYFVKQKMVVFYFSIILG